MNSKEIAKELRLSKWAQIMRERANSGLSVKDYCKKAGIKSNTYFYWQKQIRDVVGSQLMELKANNLHSNPTQTDFVEVRVPETIYQKTSQPGENHDNRIIIEIANTRINIASVYPVEKLIKLLKGVIRA